MKFFVTGDDWALVDIVPRDNLAQFEQVRAEYTEHHKDTVFSPLGWTTPPFILSAPQVPIAVRAIPLSRLAELFSGVLQPADVVATCVRDAADGIVQSMHVADVSFDTEAAKSVAERLALLGREYNLLLIGHGQLIIDLEDRDQLTAFLAR